MVQKIKQFVVLNKYYLMYSLLVLLPAFLLYLNTPKGFLNLWVDTWHTPSTDFFFKYITHFGDGLFLVIIFLITFFIPKRRQNSYFFLISFAIQGVIVLLMKHIVYSNAIRPKVFFENKIDLHFVEGVYINSFNSFPSGHTATGFVVFLWLSMMMPKKIIIVLSVLLAVLVGFSRIYLHQHFLIDTIVGAIIGIFSVLLANLLFPKLNKLSHVK